MSVLAIHSRISYERKAFDSTVREMKKSYMKKLLLRGIGIGIFVYLLGWVVDIAELGRVLRHFNPWAFVYVLPFHLGLWALRVLRWRILLRNEEIDLPFRDVMALAASGFFIGCLTPGRLGEFSKVKFLMNAGYSFRGSFMSSLLERILDIAALFFYVLFAAAVCWKALPDTLVFYLVLIALGFLGIGAAYGMRRKLKDILLSRIPESAAGSVEEKLRILGHSVHATRGNQRGWLLGYSLAMWGLNHIIIYLFFRGAGFSLPLYYSFAFSTIGSLAALIPVSIYGMGIRESMMIGMFTLIGFAPDEAKTAGFVFGLMFVLLFIYHTLWGLIWWVSPAMQRFLTGTQRDERLC